MKPSDQLAGQAPDPAGADSAAAPPGGHNVPMDLARKLQIKPGMLVSVIAAPADGPDLAAVAALQLTDSPAEAGAVIAFVRERADLAARPGRDRGGPRRPAGLDRLSEGRAARH